MFGGESRLGFRRQPKGSRAKSGCWLKRTPCPVRMGLDVEYHLARLSSEWRTREQEFRIAIDEIPDDQFHDEGYSVGGVPVRTYRSPFADPNHEGVSEADRASIEMLMMRRSNKP